MYFLFLFPAFVSPHLGGPLGSGAGFCFLKVWCVAGVMVVMLNILRRIFYPIFSLLLTLETLTPICSENSIYLI